MKHTVEIDDDIAVNKAMPFNVVFSDKSASWSEMAASWWQTALLVGPRSHYECVWVTRKQVGSICEADGNASIARVWDILEQHRPDGLFSIVNISRQWLCMVVGKAMLGAEVSLRELLDELYVVEGRGGRLLGLLYSNSLRATAAEV